nr:hypothetical protein GCM10025699_31240 [Microbacterium flavescens]
MTVTAAPLDGQVLGQNVTITGGEVHSFLFDGQISCDADSGGFEVRKTLEGIDDADLPAGTTFTVNYTATEPDGTIVTGSLEVPADGSPVPGDAEFPIGTVVEFEEISPETVPGYEWGAAAITPNPLTVGAGTADIVVANALTAQTGSFSVSKTVEDVSGGDPGEPSQATVPVDWTALEGLQEIASGTLDVPFDGTPVPVGQDFPVGTRIVLTEDLTGIDPPVGYDWSGVAWDPGRTFLIEEDGAVVAVALTNAVAPSDLDRTVTIMKSADGEAADPGYAYAVSYNTNPAGTRAERPLPVGDPELLDDIETGADTLLLAELLPTLDGAPVDPAGWTLPVITVTIDDVATTYTPQNFEGAGPLETAIVEIPLPESGDITIDVANATQVGTFELSKEFANISGDDLPDGTAFTVEWTTTTPSGEVSSGAMRLPADGTPVSPADASGEPVTFPFGTVVTFEELEPPRLRAVRWQGSSFDPAELIIGAEVVSTVTSTLTNDARQVTGTFQVAKALAGIEPSELLVDSFTVVYTATLTGEDDVSGSFEVPADGTPAGPTNQSGATVEFPIGTVVVLEEVEPDTPALPPGYAWAETTWSPGNHLVIRGEQAPVLEVTNSVERLTRWAVTKVIDGNGDSAVPADTLFPVDWWWDYDPQLPVGLREGVVVTSPWFPAGSIIQAREGDLPDVSGIEWGTPTWIANGQALVPDSEGRVTLPAATTRTEGTAELTLTNTAVADDLPMTGGAAVSPILPTAALAMVAAGLALVLRRRPTGTHAGRSRA